MTPALSPAARIARPEAALFVSDMHLDDTEPALTAQVLGDLDARIDLADRTVPGGIAGGGVALFLLGDLFEFWVGDDRLTRTATALANRLEAFAARGGRAFLMRGNRDFLLDVPLPGQPSTRPFSAACSATMLPDPSVIEVAGRRIVLSHGDALCIDDTAYQQWRVLCRSDRWQQDFLGRPLRERIGMALDLRARSSEVQAMTETLSDVDEGAASAMLTALGADLLVHGHTHRPGRHRWDAPGGAGTHERWVLGDWAVEPPRGAVMSLAEGLALPATPAG
jgi:UDP-2,3-diacylglucosamine hydrolase